MEPYCRPRNSRVSRARLSNGTQVGFKFRLSFYWTACQVLLDLTELTQNSKVLIQIFPRYWILTVMDCLNIHFRYKTKKSALTGRVNTSNLLARPPSWRRNSNLPLSLPSRKNGTTIDHKYSLLLMQSIYIQLLSEDLKLETTQNATWHKISCQVSPAI